MWSASYDPLQLLPFTHTVRRSRQLQDGHHDGQVCDDDGDDKDDGDDNDDDGDDDSDDDSDDDDDAAADDDDVVMMMMMDRQVDKLKMGRYHGRINVSRVSCSDNNFSHRMIAFLDGLPCPVE